MERRRMRLHDLSGKEVVARDQAVKLGSIGDVLFSPHDGRIGGVLLEGAGGLRALVGQQEAIPGSAIEAVGPDAVVVRDRSSVLDSADKMDRQGLVSANGIKGYEVISDDGRRLGVIKDLYCDPDQALVTDYVVGPSEGRGGGLGLGLGREAETGGREFTIPLREDVVVGRNLVTVPAGLAGQTEGHAAERHQAGYGEADRGMERPTERQNAPERPAAPGDEEYRTRQGYAPGEERTRGERFPDDRSKRERL